MKHYHVTQCQAQFLEDHDLGTIVESCCNHQVFYIRLGITSEKPEEKLDQC